MADYWRGGWAEMGQLPGTMAAQTAKASGGSYGPLNAVADILGAYMMKRNRDKANKEIDEFEASFDSKISPTPQVSAPSVMEGLVASQQGQEAQAPQVAAPPMSFKDYSSKAKGLQSQLLRNLQRKRGIAITPEMVQYVQDVTNDKIKAYGGQRLQEISPQVFRGGITQMGLPELYKQVMEYNQIAQAIGEPTVDIGQLIQSQAMKLANVDAGGQIIQQAAPATGLPIGYDKDGNAVYSQVAGTFSKSLSPKDIQAGQLKRDELTQKQQQWIYDFGERQRHNSAMEGIGADNAETARNKYNLSREYFDYKKKHGGIKDYTQGKPGQKTMAFLNGMKSLEQQYRDSVGEEGGEKAVSSLKNYRGSIQDAFENGVIDDEDREYFESKAFGLEGEYYKIRGDDDRAAMAWAKVSPEVWAQFYAPTYGKQPYTR